MTSYPSKPTSSSRVDAGYSAGVSTRAAASGGAGATRKPTSAKAQAMVGELELVKSNIILTNVRGRMTLGNDRQFGPKSEEAG